MSENRVSRGINACIIRGERNPASVPVLKAVQLLLELFVNSIYTEAHFETEANISVV